MSTPELSDDELDALFRQGAEDYPEEVNLGAWARMEQKLDEAELQRRVNQKVARLFVAELAVVLLALLLWLGYRQYTAPAGAFAPLAKAARQTATPAAENEFLTAPTSAPTAGKAEVANGSAKRSVNAIIGATEAEAAEATKPSAPVAAGPEVAALTKEAPRAEAVVSPARRPKRQAQLVAAGPAGTVTKHETTSRRYASTGTFHPAVAPERAPTPAGRKRASATAATGGAAGGLPVSAGAPSRPTLQAGELPARLKSTRRADSFAPDNDILTTNNLSNTTARHELPALSPILTGLSRAPHPLPALLPPVALAAAPDSVARPAPRPKPAHRLVVGMQYSPDFSTVQFAAVEAPGTNFGVQLEYRFTDRLRLSTGLLRADKLYRARWQDYTMPVKYTLPPGYTASYDWVHGTCTVLDLPLNLRYDWLARPRNRAFASAGLSSFLMRREHYSYDYYIRNEAYNYEQEYQWDKHILNGKNHWLSVLNVSVGYERQLSSRWSLQAEPYVKLPLGGVGYGSIRLLSGGVLLGLKYGL